MMRRWIVFFLLFATAAGASALEPEQVLISYLVKTRAGEVSGVARTLEWSLVALSEESARVRVRVPIEAFESGHRGFDALVRAAIDAPYVEISGTAGVNRFEGTLALGGVVRPLSIPIGTIRREGEVVVNASFAIDLRDYGIALPGVEAQASIDFVACLATSGRAVLAGGFIAAPRPGGGR